MSRSAEKAGEFPFVVTSLTQMQALVVFDELIIRNEITMFELVGKRIETGHKAGLLRLLQ